MNLWNSLNVRVKNFKSVQKVNNSNQCLEQENLKKGNDTLI